MVKYGTFMADAILVAPPPRKSSIRAGKLLSANAPFSNTPFLGCDIHTHAHAQYGL